MEVGEVGDIVIFLLCSMNLNVHIFPGWVSRDSESAEEVDILYEKAYKLTEESKRNIILACWPRRKLESYSSETSNSNLPMT
jgi:hypothetical protein